MKNFLFLSGIYFGALLLIPTESIAQWQVDVRLTNDILTSYTSLNNAWCVASTGNNVFAVWFDERDGNPEIYYKRSTDGGISWEADARLTNTNAQSNVPSIALSGSDVHVVWRDVQDGNAEIYHKHSTDNGTTWGTDTRLSNNTSASDFPSVSVSGSDVHVVWRDFRNNDDEIYYKHSTDSGTNWGLETRLTNSSGLSEEPSVSTSGSFVHVAWYDSRDLNGNVEIYYKRSTDSGTSWGADTRLTNNPATSYEPSISVSESVVHLVWRDDRDGNFEIYYKRSTDNGTNWSADTRLTNASGDSWYPSVSVSNSFVHTVWQENRDGNFEIYYKRSTDSGTSWEADTRLTSNDYFSWYPSVSSSGSGVHVVWQDFRDGNWEIYYKRDPNGNVTGIENVNSELATAFKLEQNYPNPFNPSSIIGYRLSVNSMVTLKVYDLIGREVVTLVNEEKQAGSYETEFQSAVGNLQLASGIYYYQLRAGDYIETKKMILIK
jgi:hypothetical protein